MIEIEVLHPYLGYVLNPDSGEEDWARAGWPRPAIDLFGLEGARPEGESGDLKLAIVGGSVAKALCAHGRDALVERFFADSKLASRPVRLACLALGGYKQPQQLMSVAYLLTMGAVYDAVINVDGFNEVALHGAENLHQKICPSFPRVWYGRSALLPDRSRLEILGEIAVIRRELAGLNRAAAGLGRLRLIVGRLGRRESLENKLQDLEDRLRHHETSDPPPLNRGLFDGVPLYEAMGRIWASSSRQVAALCRGNRIRYFHFLQPNQYFGGSKPLSSEEIRMAFDPNHPYRLGVEQGYPVLRRLGRELHANGVDFVDLSMLFESCEESLYADTCCHLNEKGNALLGEAIGRHLASQWHTAEQERPRKPGTEKSRL